MFQTALLIVTRPVSWVRGQIPVYLSEINRLVSKTVYIHIQSENNREPDQTYKYAHKALPYTWELRNLVKEFYSSSPSSCGNLDVRVLLDNISNSNKILGDYKLKNACDLVITDRLLSTQAESDLLAAVRSSFSLGPEVVLKTLDVGKDEDDQAKKQKLENVKDDAIAQVSNTVLGGTFDRLHAGHKLLLSEGCLLATTSLTIGVTDGDMNAKKTLCELILLTSERIATLREFLEDVKPSLQYKLEPIVDMFGPSTVDPDLDLIVLSQETQRGGAKINAEREKKPIVDMFGPSTVDPDLDLIVLSQETQRGGTKINAEREKKGLKTLQEYTIELIEDKCHSQFEEEKVSSSSLRKRLLGTLFHPVKPGVDLSERPYIIGLTGGICSGKSAICKRLEGLGAAAVDCDKLGHKAYVKGTPGFEKVVAAFGEDIVGEDGEVNRRVLGGKVFADKGQMQLLNSIVWPEIAALARGEIKRLSEAGHGVIVLEAAVLLEAGWNDMVHEIWLTIIPPDEAVKRMMDRNKLPEDQAIQRLAAQISNTERVQKSNVVLSSLWEYEYTQSQVETAWKLLQQRISSTTGGKQTSNL